MDTLVERIGSYFGCREEVIAVYLFGSYAQRRERDFSDVDLGVLLNKTDTQFSRDNRVRYTKELGRLLRKDIDLVILNQASLRLLKQVFAKGICVVVRDARRLAEFKMVKFVQIAEFAHYQSRAQAGLVKSVMEG